MSIIISLCFLLLSAQVFAIEEPQLEPVKLQLKWFHAFQFAGYYAAKEQGYYADVGLDVQFIERSMNKPVVQEVVTGQANYGIENAGILIEYANGTPIKALAAIFQNTALIFISKQSSGIISPEGMKGKRIMMFDDGDGGDEAPLRALLRDAQLTNQDYTHIPQSFNNDDLINDKTDVLSSYITDQPFYFKNKGVKINIINPQNYGFNFYGDLLFTSEAELANHPGRARRFHQASIKGWQYALNHIEELVQLIHTQYHSKSSIEHLRFEAKETSKLIAANSIPIGQIKSTRLQRIAEMYHELNLVKKLSRAELKNFIYERRRDLNLTADEHQWLDKHPVIRLGIDNNFAPHEWIDKQGHYVGHSADYIKLIEQRLNIKFEMIKDKPWDDVLTMAKQGSLDMLADVNSTPQRLDYLSFTDSYNDNPTIIVGNTSHSYFGTLDNLHNKTVAIEKSYFINELLQQDYPDINIIPVENTAAALLLVSKGEADAYIGDAATANYAITQSGLLNLHFAGQTDYVNQHSIAVVKSQPVLFSIINKALKSITRQERTRINNRWLGLKIEPGIKTETLFKYGLAALILFSLFVYWILRLRQEITKRQLNEQTLKETESRFTNSQQLANFGVWDWDILSNSLYWSETVAPLLGYQAGKTQASYQLFVDAVHPDDRKKVIDAIEACLKFDQPYNLEHRVFWPDQSIHWVHEAGNVIRDQDGKPIQMLGTVRDITDKKVVENVLLTLAESKASEKENIFRLIVRELAISQDINYAVIGRISAHTPGLVDTLAVWGNGSYVDNFSYPLKGTPCENVAEDGYCLVCDEVQSLFPNDHMLVDMQVKSYLGVPLKDSKQNIVGILALLDRKPMKTQLQTESLLNSLAVRAAIELERSKSTESLQVADLVYKSTREAMAMSDADSNIVAINPAFTEITGYCEQDVIGKNPRVLQSKYQPPKFLNEIWQSVIQTGKWQGEVKNISKKGKDYTVWLTINTILDNAGEVFRYVVLFSDITELKSAENALKHHRDTLQQEVKRQTHSLELAKNEAEQANHTKSEFLANMSHELRTPMHGILSFTRLGIKNVKAAELENLARYFDRINTSAERLLILLNDLLDLSKLEAGKMEINKKRHDLHKLVNQCIAEQQSWLNERQLKISWQQICDTPIALFDSARISQVMTNLLSNAIKFSEHGKTIYLSITDTQLDNQPALLFTLRDEGLGIPEKELATVFDKFIQSSKTSTGAGGTGLGLAICIEIINIHQGKIWAEQSEAGGAVFKFIIPV